MLVPVDEPGGEPSGRLTRGRSGRFLEGHPGDLTAAGRKLGPNRTVAKLLLLQAFSLPQVRMVDTGRTGKQGRPIKKRTVVKLASLHDMVARLQEILRDAAPENRRNILQLMTLTKDLFDEAEGATGGPPRITKFVYAGDSPAGKKTESAPAPGPPTPGPAGP